MYRRVLTLVLLPTLLLTQWASVRQCHGCSQELGHELTPHIHLKAWPFAACASPVHPHHHDGDSEDGDAGALARCHEDAADHPEEGVVYLPTDLLHGWFRASDSHEAGKILTLALPDLLTIPLPLFHSPQTLPFFPTVPDHITCLRSLPLLI